MLDFIIYWVLGVGGCWLLGDAVYSIALYLNTPGYDGHSKQTWRKDHWIRVLRSIIGVVMVVSGWLLFRVQG